MNTGKKKFFTKCLGFAGAILLLAGFSPAAHGAQSLSLEWNASKDKKVAGYFLHYGTKSGNYTAKVSVAKKKPAITVPGLQEGATYYFTVTAVDSQGVESLPSKEISYIVPGVLALGERTKPSDPARVKFPVAPKHKYEVQATDDMRSWATIGVVKGVTNGWVEFDDASAAAHPQRFYRLVLH
jgi:hypothetical protein